MNNYESIDLIITWKCNGNDNIDNNKWMEDLRNSTLDTAFDFSRKSLSGRTTSRAASTAGTKTCTPSRSRRNKSAELDSILASVSPHSLV